jgi:hypothetical protein
VARPTLNTHPKFAKLAQRLRSRALARGSLELLWESCYASGDPRVGDAVTVEALADWRGKAGELAFALTDAGFLDQEMDQETGKSTFVVHDLEDHAPDYVLKRWEREAKRRSTGQTLRSVRQAAAREMWKRRSANDLQADASDRHLQDTVSHLQATVAPPISVLSGSSLPFSSQSGSDARAESETGASRSPMTGHRLRSLFAEVRSRLVGGLPWQVPRVAEGKDASMAEIVNGDPDAPADVVPTMELLFKLAKGGKAGAKSADIMRDGSFAFGAWCSQWTALRERLHGKSPEVPAAARAAAGATPAAYGKL